MAENPFSKATTYLRRMGVKNRKELSKAQGEYGVAVAESVRGSHRVWRKGRSGDKAKGTEKRYI